jgi:hypothetical protein
MAIIRVSLAMSYTSQVYITCTEVTSSYEQISYDDDDDDDDSNNYSIQLLFSNVLISTTKCPFRETTEYTNY